MNFPVSVTAEYTKKNILEMQKSIHRRTRRRFRLLSLVGAALFIVGSVLLGIIEGVGALMFAGILWFILCNIFANQQARKTARKTVKRNMTNYGCTVQTTIKFYNTMFTAKNETTGAEVRAQYTDVTRLVGTKNLIVLVLEDGRAMMAERASVDPAIAAELWEYLRENCSDATVLV